MGIKGVSGTDIRHLVGFLLPVALALTKSGVCTSNIQGRAHMQCEP